MTEKIQNNSQTVLDTIKTKVNETDESKKEKRVDETQKEDFLNILVAQLQNQDPLNPMENDQFAVDLAQFSQVEQLINLNEKFDNQSSSSGSLAQYLGQQVELNWDNISLQEGSDESLAVTLNGNATEVKVELLDDKDVVKETIELGSLSSGNHSIDLKDLADEKGVTKFKVKATDDSGNEVKLTSGVSGIVSGFVPGASGSLLIGNREFSLDSVKKVSIAPSNII
jgi:flagellar basal-body rod modification protein FlgD